MIFQHRQVASTEPDVVIWAKIGISLITGCMSSAHVERANSVAKWILNDKKNLLGDEELEANKQGALHSFLPVFE